VPGPIVLVGHSYGGTLITHPGTDPRVAALVYIAALAPDDDETSQSRQSKFRRTDVFGYIDVMDGRIWLKPSGLACFCGDLPGAERKFVYATQGVPVPDLFDQKVEGTAWEDQAKLVHHRHEGPHAAFSTRYGAQSQQAEAFALGIRNDVARGQFSAQFSNIGGGATSGRS
jgi:pimeloyl-ACP methyl ester carboxylesterase